MDINQQYADNIRKIVMSYGKVERSKLKFKLTQKSENKNLIINENKTEKIQNRGSGEKVKEVLNLFM